MRKFLRRPSPAMLVAMTALVASFAGPAVADEVAQMASHISGKHIKNGTVTGADVRNNTLSSPDFRNGGIFSDDIGTGQVQTPDIGDNAVRGDKVQPNTLDGSDVMDGSLGGREINEDSLGQVRSAARAGDAERLDGLDADAFERARGDEYVAEYFGNGEEVTVAEGGGLRIYATCEINPSGTSDEVTLWMSTSRDDAAMDDNNGPEYVPFNTGDSPTALFAESSDDDPNLEVTSSGSGATGVAADGSVVAFNDYALGVNLAGRDDNCFVSGHAVSVSAG